MGLTRAYRNDEGISGVVFGSVKHGLLALMAVCPGVVSVAWVNDRGGRKTVQTALTSSGDTVPLQITRSPP